jgi:hypothetical protein
MYKILIFSLVLIVGCSSNHQSSKSSNDESVGIKHETNNNKYPFIYKNGYRNYSFVNEFIIELNNENLKLNELKFEAVFSAMYTQKVMYDNYGSWNKELIIDNQLVLVWENIKLFSDNEDLFTIIARGKETKEDMFASVMVLNQSRHFEDCLSENSMIKPLVVNYFSKGIQNLNDDKTFYSLYHQAKNKYFDKK